MTKALEVFALLCVSLLVFVVGVLLAVAPDTAYRLWSMQFRLWTDKAPSDQCEEKKARFLRRLVMRVLGLGMIMLGALFSSAFLESLVRGTPSVGFQAQANSGRSVGAGWQMLLIGGGLLTVGVYATVWAKSVIRTTHRMFRLSGGIKDKALPWVILWVRLFGIWAVLVGAETFRIWWRAR